MSGLKEAPAPSLATEAVLVQSVEMPKDTPVVQGYDFSKARELDGLLSAMYTTGYQVGRWKESEIVHFPPPLHCT